MTAVGFSAGPDLSALPAYKPEMTVVGGVRLYGAYLKFTLVPLEEGFKKFHPGVIFSNNFIPSSEGAVAGLYTGLGDLAPAGDDIKITEMMAYHEMFQCLPLEVSVATGGYEARGTLWPAVIVVNKDNPIAGLTMDQLDRVFGAQRTGGFDDQGMVFTAKYGRGPETNIRTWGQLGLTGEWADKTITTYGYGPGGFPEYFCRKLMHKVQKWNPTYREYQETHAMIDIRGATEEEKKYMEPISSEQMLVDMANDRYSIGWAAIMHTKTATGVRPVAIAAKEGAPFVALTPETDANRTYPLVRDAYIYVNKFPGKPLDPKVREFLRFILSREGQEIVASVGSYFPLTPEYLQAQLHKLD
ncbi:MAG: phosphate transporter periplasmic phosphate-binding protein [Verrucomicrobia bacterium]|nr:phosphate transporter periplasmic phosphate-binding protein [Verrucomicrobiota bacterium]